VSAMKGLNETFTRVCMMNKDQKTQFASCVHIGVVGVVKCRPVDHARIVCEADLVIILKSHFATQFTRYINDRADF